jgi:hypothetical protein
MNLQLYIPGLYSRCQAVLMDTNSAIGWTAMWKSSDSSVRHWDTEQVEIGSPQATRVESSNRPQAIQMF